MNARKHSREYIVKCLTDSSGYRSGRPSWDKEGSVERVDEEEFEYDKDFVRESDIGREFDSACIDFGRGSRFCV